MTHQDHNKLPDGWECFRSDDGLKVMRFDGKGVAMTYSDSPAGGWRVSRCVTPEAAEAIRAVCKQYDEIEAGRKKADAKALSKKILASVRAAK